MNWLRFHVPGKAARRVVHYDYHCIYLQSSFLFEFDHLFRFHSLHFGWKIEITMVFLFLSVSRFLPSGGFQILWALSSPSTPCTSTTTSWQRGVHQRVQLSVRQLFYFSSTTSPFKAVVNMPGQLAFRLVYFSIWARAPIFLSLFGCKGIIFYKDLVVWRSLYLFISYCNTALLTVTFRAVV